MQPESGSSGRLRSFMLGGLVGASAVLATARRRRRRRETPPGLAAFEEAPCYRELAETEPFRAGLDDGPGTAPPRATPDVPSTI